uniref:BabB n=1 Tax=Helicobacter pylori TaxID=210 RepID=A0A0N9EJD2_HELPX|nr:BabB [Helicobacter pylori]
MKKILLLSLSLSLVFAPR